MKLSLIWLILALFLACNPKEDEEQDEDSSEKPAIKNETSSNKDGDNNNQGEETESSDTLVLSIDIPVDATEMSLASLPSINEAGKENPDELSASTLALPLVSNLVDISNNNSNGNSNDNQSSTENSDDYLQSYIGKPISYPGIQKMFAFQCWGKSDFKKKDNTYANYCPDAIKDKIGSEFIPQKKANEKSNISSRLAYEFTSYSLLGLIFQAETTAKAGFKLADKATKIDPKSIVLKAERDYDYKPITAEKPGKYVIDMLTSYDLHYTDFKTSRGYLLNSNAEEEGEYMILPWNLRDGKCKTCGASVYQSWMKLDKSKEKAKLFAINQFVASSEKQNYGFRHILLINFETDHFLLKAGWNESGHNSKVIAGKGGFDFTTGTWKEGAYYTFIKDPGSGAPDLGYCVDSKSQLLLSYDVTHEKCSFVADFFENASSFDPATFLSLTEEEAKKLSPFLELFKNSDGLTADQIPKGKTDIPNLFDEVEFDAVGPVKQESSNDMDTYDKSQKSPYSTPKPMPNSGPSCPMGMTCESICDDGKDNDGDGYADCGDADCLSTPACK